MQITLNGQPYPVGERQSDDDRPPADGHGGFSVAMLVAERQLNPRQIAVEINQKLIRREDFEQVLLADGDQVELVTLAGGG